MNDEQYAELEAYHRYLAVRALKSSIKNWQLKPPERTAILAATVELLKAQAAYKPMHSAHEGYAVIKEELDELWEEVRKKPSKVNQAALRKEAVQVAAMALRFLVDVCPVAEDDEEGEADG